MMFDFSTYFMVAVLHDPKIFIHDFNFGTKLCPIHLNAQNKFDKTQLFFVMGWYYKIQIYYNCKWITLFPRIVSAETILFWIWPYVLWPRSQYIKVRKLFKGGNYSRAVTIRGNTVVKSYHLISFKSQTRSSLTIEEFLFPQSPDWVCNQCIAVRAELNQLLPPSHRINSIHS